MIDIVKNIKSGVVEVEITEEWGTGEGVQINSGEKPIRSKFNENELKKTTF